MMEVHSLSRLRERVGDRVFPQWDCWIAEDVPTRREPSPAARGTMLRIARGASASPASGRGGASPSYV